MPLSRLLLGAGLLALMHSPAMLCQDSTDPSKAVMSERIVTTENNPQEFEKTLIAAADDTSRALSSTQDDGRDQYDIALSYLLNGLKAFQDVFKGYPNQAQRALTTEIASLNINPQNIDSSELQTIEELFAKCLEQAEYGQTIDQHTGKLIGPGVDNEQYRRAFSLQNGVNARYRLSTVLGTLEHASEVRIAASRAAQDLFVFKTRVTEGQLKQATIQLQSLQSQEDVAALGPIADFFSANRDSIEKLKETVANADRLQADMQQASDEATQAELQRQQKAQAENEITENMKKREDEVRARMRAGPPHGATIYRGIYIGEPIRMVENRCTQNAPGAIEELLSRSLSDTCWVMGGDFIEKVAFFSKSSVGDLRSSLVTQFGQPVPGLHYMLDSETRPEWVVWSTKDNMIVAAKQAHATRRDGQSISFSETIVFGPCRTFPSVLMRCEP